MRLILRLCVVLLLAGRKAAHAARWNTGADPRSRVATPVGSGIVSVTYGCDDANNRSQKIVTGGPTAGTTDYTYNSVNQLTGWTRLHQHRRLHL